MLQVFRYFFVLLQDIQEKAKKMMQQQRGKTLDKDW